LRGLRKPGTVAKVFGRKTGQATAVRSLCRADSQGRETKEELKTASRGGGLS